MEREVRYCTSEDGARIAYCVEGEGPPLVDCPANWESFANQIEEVDDAYGDLWRGRTVVRYDFRGVGLSQRSPSAFSVEHLAADIKAVADAAGVERFVLLASTLSVAPAILFAARHPERVSRLILMRIFTRGRDVMPRENLDALIALIHSNWQMASQTISDLGIRAASDPSVGIRWAEDLRENMDPADLARMLDEVYENDVLKCLEEIQCPTIIMHRRNDNTLPFSAAQHAAGLIPSARVVPLPGDGPTSIGPDAEANTQILVGFLDEDAETRAIATPKSASVASGFRAVLFTDLVGHTEMMSRLGDEKGREVLREHERITREVLAKHGGTEVKTMGDGFMASFGSVTKSVECAAALQRAFTEREGELLSARIGLNAGEPIEEEGDLFGATVILASRVAAKAEGGEILVADTVRGLCSGKGFLFADRGEFVAKGFEEPVRVFEVRWRE